MTNRFARQHTLAGVALTALAGAAMLLAIGAGGGGAASTPAMAAVGEARHASVTVDLPPAVADRVYGGPNAAGRPIVVIDPGHGGRDPGATSVSGAIAEKDLTLALASDLRDVLVSRGRLRVALTREEDRYLGLEDRTALARRLGASMFISIHTDSAPNPLARGASIYSLSDVASDAEAARLASAANGAGLASHQGDGSVSGILADLAMRSEMSASADFANRLVGKSAGRFDLRPHPHRFAAFHVLRRAEAPAVLFEAGYISNTEDELLLRSAEHRRKITLALAQAIEADVALRSRR